MDKRIIIGVVVVFIIVGIVVIQQSTVQPTLKPTAQPVPPAPAASCSNIPPDNIYSCDLQASWGKCDQPWMTAAGHCLKSCNKC